MDIFSYKLGKKAGGGGGGSTLQTKSVNITSNGSTEVSPDEGYDGMSKVNITTSVQDDSTYTNFKYYNASTNYVGSWCKRYKKTVMEDIQGTSLAYAFSGFAGEEIEIKSSVDTSAVTNFSSMFACLGLKRIIGLENLDTSSCDNFAYMFNTMGLNVPKWDKLDLTTFDTSSATTMTYMFRQTNVDEIDITGWDTSKVTSMNNMFDSCSATKITGLSGIDTSKNGSINGMFSNSTIDNIPEIDCTSVMTAGTPFGFSNTSIKNFGGFKDLGKAYDTSASANYNPYRLDVSGASNLTHDSLMNIINDVYDIASKGVATQILYLGPTNKAKLTAEEIAIATNKGWSV